MNRLALKGPRYKLVKPHVEGCLALENVRRGFWDTPWWMPPEKCRYLDSLGRRTRYAQRRWIVLRCNTVQNPDLPGGCCDAELLVREDYILTDAPVGSEERVRTP